MVIDLGFDPQPRPVAPPRGWWRSRRRLRPATLAACTALALALAGAAPDPGPPLVEVASPEIGAKGDFVMAGDRLFVTSADPTLDSGWALSAYELPGGRFLWRVPYRAGTGKAFPIRRAGAYVLVNAGRAGDGGRTSVLDATTGQTRWEVSSAIVPTDDGRTGLVSEAVGPPAAEGPRPSAVRGLDLATGRELWSAVFPATVSVFPAADGEILLLDGAGRVEARDARSGTVTRTRDVIASGPGPLLVGDSLLLRGRIADGNGVVAYAADTLEQRWTRPVPDGLGRLTECGPMVCFPAGDGIEAVDPVSGRLAWRMPETDLVADFGGYLVAIDVDGSAEGRAQIIDPVSGRTIGGLADWETRLDGQGDAAFVGVRPAATGDRTWLAVLARPASAVRVLGMVPYPVSHCVGGAANIVCRAAPDLLRVWTYRS